MAVLDDSSSSLFMVDEAYEFSAPRFYDFKIGETDDDVRKAELWFENARSYPHSPFMPRIKGSRQVEQILCSFNEEQQIHKEESESELKPLNQTINQAEISSSDKIKEVQTHKSPEAELSQAETKENVSINNLIQILCSFNEEQQIHKEESESELKPRNQTINQAEISSSDKIKEVQTHKSPEAELSQAETKENDPKTEKTLGRNTCSQENGSLERADKAASSVPKEDAVQGPEVCCTPAPQKLRENKVQTAKKIASMLRNPSAMNSKKQLPKSQAKSTKPVIVRRDPNAKNIVGTPIFAQENHAIKRQKLEGGKSKQILTVTKPSNLPHKTRTGIISNKSSFSYSAANTSKEDRKMYVREPAAPFVSMAEMMRKFQSGTREVSLSRSSCSISQSDAGVVKTKPKLTLTRPKTPEFETSQRVRSVKLKSSAEIEEEMMAKVPKFKARPLNKKIFEAPSLTPLPRSTPHLPEFKEFHLETMSRANHNAEVSTVASTDSIEVKKSHQWRPHLTAPKSPLLQTSLRARPPKIKTFEELEKEELENIPQFKARPLNRKIFESKGDMGIFSNMKKQVTIPQEFNFAVDKRIPPPTQVLDLFDKLSICSESHHEKPPLPRLTTPNPFHLHTDERGAEKEKRLAKELLQKQLEEERARVPVAHPYPYTTDYPVVPPKPEPKPCTKPSPFQLESLVRHEEEMQREMEERRRKEMEEEEMRKFRAQPILKEDPIPVPEKERIPLTEVQEFNLHVINRAVDRAEFDKKLKEKEMVHKRYREEAEAAKMMEEEKALKQLRRTLVPHARPVPSFDHPFLPQKSGKEITKAKSPKLRVNLRKEKQRRMVCPASGAAAFHMR